MMIFQKLRPWLVMLIVALSSVAFAVSAAPSQRTAFILELDGAIGPASASYVADGMERARKERAELVIIKMDTPGGLDTSMREIIREILAMPLPVVTYVHPSGARAASAGTYILYASHVAAMTPGTNLGAATPIQIGGSPAKPQSDEEEEANAPSQSASEKKAVNDAVAYIRSLAEMRGRNADWAEKAVREAASLSANAALEQQVVDVVAQDAASLLEQINGMKVVISGTSHVLDTSGIELVNIEPDWSTKILATITNPNVALILMMVGFYGLIFEFMNPGALVPGTIGAISLLIGLYALAALPVDFVGLALILLGIALMVGEAFAPSFGVLGIGGLVAFAFGAALLFDTDLPAFQVNWSIIGTLGVFSAGLIAIVARVGIRSQRGRVQTGKQEMVGARGKVLDWDHGAGHVLVHSERWNAVGPSFLSKDAAVIVHSLDGLQLSVAPYDETQT